MRKIKEVTTFQDDGLVEVLKKNISNWLALVGRSARLGCTALKVPPG
jgi:hypothetical protein